MVHPEDVCKSPQIGINKDGSAIICWHPEELDFPYEHTKPIVRTEADRISNNTASEVLNTFPEQRDPSNEELMQMFYTTKHQWAPKPGKRYIKSRVIRDREGL
ncbi:DgyrCDS4813 [Dimorphilus gyrociliatus]|uniref:Large ribosomal subunit protein mL42 n=1 Tax=Dimorphilus gyrociliatus TaxID=2664684 RepID=A0A7I8VHV0_9ANNE|nr:DgyrCDS4813 [Dimorphilus gyrociliatus]